MAVRMEVRAQVKEELRRKNRQDLATDWKRGGRKAPPPFCWETPGGMLVPLTEARVKEEELVWGEGCGV